VQFLNKRLIFKNIVSEIVGSMVVWALAKNTCARAYKTLLCCSVWILCPWTKLPTCPLNGLRRRVATHDKTQTKTQMDELLVALDPGHRVSASGAPPLSFCCPKKICWRIL
jgi:hypothetical protein